MKSEAFNYSDGADHFIGHLAWDETLDGPQPLVLIAPAFGGLSDFERARAEELAALGYVAIAVDYYGNGKRAGSPEEAQALMGRLQADRKILARRMVAACDVAKALPQVDAGRIGAMGYCLGGKAVLDLARTGADIRACAPLHGVYDRPNFETKTIHASVLVLHGWDDPLAPPEALQALAAELSAHCADWQVLGFGHTGHAFTNPNAQDRDGGMMYNARATARAWEALTGFLAETLQN
ncbi:dienelactone hydrolase family protein [Tritonibacter mobilis]|uniref:dienelactone hydrolase family protein n=1 Tax=Tritonibacter mobilis TaxID=379347 RepID=UPI001C0A3E7B|nr:dienelactone hydrolase family protein [Tritonibacter mobilis]MBU3035155.1 dienelactone hydrolase family protein [Tritonibacter mobilis]WHQ83619.1 dienelactone hydrolase family protein [Tritonibacter mobilis]